MKGYASLWYEHLKKSRELKKYKDKRFLHFVYKQELYLKITSLNQVNLIEEYIREFEQLQIRVSLDEEPELKIARSITELSPRIANTVDLELYLSFDDVCHLAIKLKKKKLKGRKLLQTTSICPQNTTKGYSSHNKVDTTLTPIEPIDKA